MSLEGFLCATSKTIVHYAVNSTSRLSVHEVDDIYLHDIAAICGPELTVEKYSSSDGLSVKRVVCAGTLIPSFNDIKPRTRSRAEKRLFSKFQSSNILHTSTEAIVFI